MESTTDETLKALAKSKFRNSIKLSRDDAAYLGRLDQTKIQSHAERFVRERLADAEPVRDGKQTPWKGHPVFSAQHATATCCRGCLAKWHAIEKGKPLSETEISLIVTLIVAWLDRQPLPAETKSTRKESLPLFEFYAVDDHCGDQ